MATDIFIGRPSPKVTQWIIDNYYHEDRLKLIVQTSGEYMKSGIYEATRDDASKPVTIDWGDGIIEQVDGDVS